MVELRVGQETHLEIARSGTPRTVTIRIAEAANDALAGEGLHPNLAGATFGETEKSAKARVKGVAVTRVEAQSPASDLGLREGDVITSVNRSRVEGLEDFTRLVRQSGSSLLLGMRRGASSVYVLVR